MLVIPKMEVWKRNFCGILIFRNIGGIDTEVVLIKPRHAEYRDEHQPLAHLPTRTLYSHNTLSITLHPPPPTPHLLTLNPPIFLSASSCSSLSFFILAALHALHSSLLYCSTVTEYPQPGRQGRKRVSLTKLRQPSCFRSRCQQICRHEGEA